MSKGMKVKTDYDKGSNITAGKEYEMVYSDEWANNVVIDDEGDELVIVEPKYNMTCPHLDGGGYWGYVE